MENLTAGRMVHVVAAREGHQRCQPAIVVRVWEDEPKAYVNLTVLRDGSNDAKFDGLGYNMGQYDNAIGSALSRWATSVYEGQEPSQFHDPRECTVEQIN